MAWIPKMQCMNQHTRKVHCSFTHHHSLESTADYCCGWDAFFTTKTTLFPSPTQLFSTFLEHNRDSWSFEHVWRVFLISKKVTIDVFYQCFPGESDKKKSRIKAPIYHNSVKRSAVGLVACGRGATCFLLERRVVGSFQGLFPSQEVSYMSAPRRKKPWHPPERVWGRIVGGRHLDRVCLEKRGW